MVKSPKSEWLHTFSCAPTIIFMPGSSSATLLPRKSNEPSPTSGAPCASKLLCMPWNVLL